MRLNALLRALVDELAADGVPDPLAQPRTLALVWADLAPPTRAAPAQRASAWKCAASARRRRRVSQRKTKRSSGSRMARHQRGLAVKLKV